MALPWDLGFLTTAKRVQTPSMGQRQILNFGGQTGLIPPYFTGQAATGPAPLQGEEKQAPPREEAEIRNSAWDRMHFWGHSEVVDTALD